MKILLFYVTTAATMWWLGVEGVYREKFVKTTKLASSAIPNDALFGYSLAYQDTNRLIVSAPRADSVGKVYECSNEKYSTEVYYCTEIIFPGIKESRITGMWLGASVASGNNFTIACAPRAITEALNLNNSKTGTYGKCYVHTTDGKTTQLQQLKTSDRVHVSKTKPKLLEEYMDSFGWALEVDRRNSIIVGGPGMYKGRVIKYSSVSAYPSSFYLQHLPVFPYRINYNIGYSVSSGYFIKDIFLYAVSSPYGINGEGMVILTTGGPVSWSLPTAKEYRPPVGSLFGASLCAAKLRGVSQREALLVGASLYPAKGGVDVGAVYVYQYDPAMSRADFKYQVVHQKTILGIGDRGQFGSAIINLGDINGDKRDDVAISAPYEDDGRGSVYIYSGADILGDDPADQVQYLQRLQPEGFATFGFSMATLKPHGGSCRSLAIGAPVNNTVFIYPCIPKVIVRVMKLKSNPRYRRSNTEFQYEACIDVEYPNDLLAVTVELKLEVALTHPTASIKNANDNNLWSKTINLLNFNKMKEICNELNIVLPEEGSSPQIQYQMSVSQMNPPIGLPYYEQSQAMLSDVSLLTLTDTLWVADCADKCKPVLTFDVSTTLQNGYVIGSTKNELVSVSVHNTGDPAYMSCVHVAVSHNVRKWPRACWPTGPGAGTCAPDRPLRTSWNTGDILLEMNTLRSDVKELAFTVNLYEECSPELIAPSLNTTRTIGLNTDSKGLVVREYTNFGNTIYLSFDEIRETGKQLSHIYTVSNRGSTTWVDIACSIVLDKRSFFKRLVVTIDTQATYKCESEVEIENSDQYTTKCNASELKSDQKFDVIVSIYIEPGTVDWIGLENDNITLTSYFRVSFGGKAIDHTITSILRKKEAVVPLWVIIVSALVGLLILFLIAFALYECGFLKRKKKEELEKLRRSVHRQSMRRSAIDRESKRNINKAMDPQSDKNKLIEESEDSDTPNLSSSTADKPLPLAEGKKYPMTGEKKKPPLPETIPIANQLKKPLRTASPSRPKSAIDEVPLEKQSGSVPPPTDGEKIKKELIILGLQKNLGKYPVKPPKPARPQEPSDQPEDTLS